MSSRLIFIFLLLSVALSAQTTREPFEVEACDPELLCVEFSKILARTNDFLDGKEGGKAYRELKALEACTKCPEHRDNLDALSAEIVALFEEQNNSLQALIDQAEQQNEELADLVTALRNRELELNEQKEKANQQAAKNEEMTREALVDNYMRLAREALQGGGAIGTQDAIWLTDFTYHYVDSTHHTVRLMLHDLLHTRILEGLPYDLFEYAEAWENASPADQQVEEVLAAAWSSDEQWLAVGTSEGRLLIFAASGELVLEQTEYDYVSEVAWKPNEPTLVFLKNLVDLGSVSFINDSWVERPINDVFSYVLEDIVWAPNGELLAIAADDNSVYLWDLEEEKPYLLGLHEASISDLAWSPDGTQLVASDHSGAISFWSVAQQELRFRRTGHTDYARTVAWHPDGLTIISGGDDNKLLFWDTLGQITQRQEFPTWVLAADFSQSGDQIALRTLDENLFIVNTITGERRQSFMPIGIKQGAWRGEVNTADSAGELLLAFDETATFPLVDVGKQALEEFNFRQNTGELAAGDISRVRWSPDGNFLAYDKDYELIVIGPEEIIRFDLVGAEIHDLSWHPGLSPSLPQTNFLATVASNNRLVIWDVVAGTVAQQRELEVEALSVAWSPDGQYLAVGNNEGTLQIFNNQLELLVETDLHSDFIRSLAWSPNGLYLATASDDHTSVIYEVESARVVMRLQEHHDWLRRVLWLDDTHLLTAGDDTQTILWELDPAGSQAVILQVLDAISGYHQALAYLPQRRGGTLAIGSSAGELGLWNVEANWGVKYDTTFIFDQMIEGLNWHPRGRSLAINTFATVPYELGWYNTLQPAYAGIDKPVRTIVANNILLEGSGGVFQYFYLPELKVQPYLFDQVAWSADERWLGVIQLPETGTGKKRVELHDLENREIVRAFELESNPAQLLFSPGGRYLAITPDRGDVVVLPTGSTKDTLFLSMSAADDFMAWTWSADSRYLAVLDRSLRVHIHDLETGGVQHLDSGSEEYDLATITFYPANDRWLHLFTQQGIYELDRQSGTQGQRIYEPPGYVPGSISDMAPRPQAEWLPNGREVIYRQANNPPVLLALEPGRANAKVFFGESENLHAWSLERGVIHELEPMRLDKGEYFSRELEYPRIWQVATGEVRGRLQPARRQLIEEMELSTDGTYLLTQGARLFQAEGKYVADDEPYLIIWQIDEQQEVFELSIPSGLKAGFSPRGNYLYVYYENGRVMLWPLNTATVGQYFAESGKDQYLEQLFPGESIGFVDRIVNWELERGIEFKEQENFNLLQEREQASVRRYWSAYYAEQVWLEEAAVAANQHFAKATSLHLEPDGRSIRSHPIDTSALANIWFEQAYFAIYNGQLGAAANYVRQIQTVRPQSTRIRMLQQLLAWHQGQRQPVIRTLFSTRRDALERELNNWERRNLSLDEKGQLERYIALSTGQQDPSTPMVEPTFIGTIPADLSPPFRDSLIRAYYNTNMQHESFRQGSGSRVQQFWSEAARYFEGVWRENPEDEDLAQNLSVYNYQLQVAAYEKGQLSKALNYAERNVGLWESLLAKENPDLDGNEGRYLEALAESIFIRLREDPGQAAALRDEAVSAQSRFPEVTDAYYLSFQQAHCELILGKPKAAYQLYYRVLKAYPRSGDQIAAQIEAEVADLAPRRWSALDQVLERYQEYYQLIEDYDNSLYALEDPATAVEPELLDENFWLAYNSMKLRLEAAQGLATAEMMPADDLQEEVERFSSIASTYAHVLLQNGSWKELPVLLSTVEEYLPQYNWPRAMEAIVSLMEGDWRGSQRLLRRIGRLTNDGYLAEDYPRLRDYLLNLPEGMVNTSAFQERRAEWLNALDQ